MSKDVKRTFIALIGLFVMLVILSMFCLVCLKEASVYTHYNKDVDMLVVIDDLSIETIQSMNYSRSAIFEDTTGLWFIGNSTENYYFSRDGEYLILTNKDTGVTQICEQGGLNKYVVFLWKKFVITVL